MTDWYKLDKAQALDMLTVGEAAGLSNAVAEERSRTYGPNELVESGERGPLQILWEQFTATMVLILIAASLVSALLGEWKDAIAIGAIVILFALLGFVQEYRAEKAMLALRRLAVPTVKVRRGGQLSEVSARSLVPGDVVLLEAGNLIPADARLLEAVNLRIQEAALTGESEPVEKAAEALPGADLPLGDRVNMAYMGTVVTYGRGAALVVETGMRTELGRIASLLQAVEQEQTPLQKRLDQLGRLLATVGLTVAAIIFGLGLLRGEAIRDMLLTAVSIAVAIVPEGLPAVVTITLALGAQRMLKRQALIRKLPAVETLGSVTVICSDKTGTLTENKMTVIVVDVAGQQMDMVETLRGQMPVLEAGGADRPAAPDSVKLVLSGAALCNDALLKPDPAAGSFHTIGDPTEGALLVAAARSGLAKADLESRMPRIGEVPFDSDRKRMTTIHQARGGSLNGHLPATPQDDYLGFTKGAVDSLLQVSSYVWADGQATPMSPAWLERIQAANDALAQQGMRVLGVSFRRLAALPEKLDQIEQELVFVGMVGMIDPPRAEVKAAVQTCRSAGIRPVMITGDHPLTARQIAKELGIAENDRVLTGQELAVMSENDLAQVVDTVSVYARVSPEHKLRIIQALQSRGQVVAMTGDGVNDAPALRKADIGVAMGITGTDVSKEAADMVLQDDNFATIVSAVEEGRTIYDNLRKFVKYSVAGNIGKVSVMLLAPFLGKPLPLLPLQLLWLNLLTDGLLGLGLGVEPPEKNVMKRPPIAPGARFFSGGLGSHVLWVGALIGALGLGIGYVYWLADPDGSWQTMTFSVLAFAQLGQALATRSTRESLFMLGIASNPAGMVIAAVTFLLQLAVIYTPFLQDFFGTKPLTMLDLLVCVGAGVVVFTALEVEKWLVRRRG